MQLPKNERYTVKDYRSWPDDQRWELIDGVPHAMAPGAGVSHQSLAGEIFFLLRSYLHGKSCRVFTAPFDVYLSDEEDGNTVVQPDVLVVCDPKKITKRGVAGAPDIVIEVLSPSTAGRDFAEKLPLYQREGVPEYWIVSPEEKNIYQYVLTDGQYEMKRLSEGSLISSVLKDFALDVGALFAVLDGLPEE